MRIGLFDSGVGGLTVLKNLIKKYPNNEYIYFGDTIHIPYGTKTKKELEMFSSSIIEFLISKNVDVIIIACGTVSSNIASVLRDKYSIPIIDIISSTINYVNSSNYNKIGVLATNNTIKSKIFNEKLNKDVKEVACTKFVPLIEENNIEELQTYMPTYLEGLKDRELIILGCTHYPIVKDKISNYFDDKIKLLDMSDCLPNVFMDNSQKKVELYFSKIDDILKNNVLTIFGPDFDSMQLVKNKNQL